MKQAILSSVFSDFAKAKNLKVDNSRFDGEKYITAKPGTICMKSADARCGNRYAIVLNRQSGGISPLTSYLKPDELVAYMEGATDNLKAKIKQYS